MSHNLVMDIGGTNARIAISTPDGIQNVESKKYDSVASLKKVVTQYAEKHGIDNVDNLVMAIAGDSADPKDICFTNGNLAGQRIDVSGFADNVVTINDFTAQGYAPKVLAPDDYELVAEIPPKLHIPSEHVITSLDSTDDLDLSKRIVMVGPGTGLGVASVFITNSGEYTVLDGEGGHVDFAPRTQYEFNIFDKLSERFGEVSCETFCSGPGLVKVYQACSDDMSDIKPAEVVQKAHAEMINLQKTKNTDEIPAINTIELFSAALGCAVKSAALPVKAGGGVIITGDLFHHLKDIFNYDVFEERMRTNTLPESSNFMNDMPVYAVAKGRDSGLMGAHVYAQTKLDLAI